MASPAPTPARSGDPLPAFCFQLEIAEIEGGSALFRSVSGLKSETEVVPFKEGGVNATSRQLIGATRWPNLVFKRGFAGPPFGLFKWRQRVVEHDRGRKLPRLSGTIHQLRHDLTTVCSWSFVAGWPCRWEGPEYDASRSELAIETIEVAHEGLRLVESRRAP